MRAGLLAAILSFASAAAAWDRHHVMTRLALQNSPELKGQALPETLGEYLKASGFQGDEKAWLKSLKLNANTQFTFGAGEKPGELFSLRRVVEHYSDEPDWGIDQNLFDQYPELWKDDYLYMGGGKSFQSRAFRHMFWPGGFYKPPPAGGRKPVKDPTPLGEAHERAGIFFMKSREAFAAGHPYWGARFLGWALHYLEDLTMPFHAVQLPSTAFIRFKADGTPDVEATTRFVAYLHLALDAYAPRAAEGELGEGPAARVKKAMVGGAAAAFVDPVEPARKAAECAAKNARACGEAVKEFFPELTDEGAQDPIGFVFNDRFWAEVRDIHVQRPQDGEALLEELEPVLAAGSGSVRAFVAAAVSGTPVDPALIAAELARRVALSGQAIARSLAQWSWR